MSLNREGFLKSKRGPRQGDSISHYLFMMAMEVLSRILSKIVEHKEFEFHWKCKSNRITYICFVDDLILFCKVEEKSISLLVEALDKFYLSFGFKHNKAKSNVFFSGIAREDRQKYSIMLGMEESSIPFKYSGVPLIDSKIH